jgi:hypothetical protein
VAESLVSFGTTLSLTFRNLKFLPSSDNFPNDVSILAIARVEVLDSRERCFRDVGVVSAKQITVVVDDIGTIIQPPHSHILLAVQRNPVPEELFLHFPSGTRCDRDFVLARTEDQNAQANGNAKA